MSALGRQKSAKNGRSPVELTDNALRNIKNFNEGSGTLE